jgi:ATP-dependent Clp protease ATP-binding subunit ClpB
LVDFKNTVIIMTSNVGSQRIFEAAGDRKRAAEVVNQELLKQFRPEFLNRIDDKIIFDPLNRENMDHILDIQLKRVSRLMKTRELRLEVSAAARTMLCDIGYDPAFGARPLKRVITQALMNPLSKEIVGGGYLAGDTIRVDRAGDGAVTFERVPAPEPVGAEG